MAKARKPKFKLNRKAFRQLAEGVRPELEAHARSVAESAAASLPGDVPVETSSETNQEGRPVVLVAIAHPSGVARQAKDGVLTRAASASRLEVTRYPAKG